VHSGSWKRRIPRSAVRAIPGLAIALAFAHLLRGGFTGFAQLGWWEVGLTAFLLLGIGLSSTRQFRRMGSGATALFRDDVELGGGLIAAGYLLVAVGGPALFPIVYLLMAFLVSFFPRRVGLTLLGVALIFDAATTLILTGPSLTGLLPHAAFLILFAALYHLVLTARLATAKKAEKQAVQKRVAEVEEQARTFRLVSSGTEHNLADTKGHEKWLMASVKEVEGAMGRALEIAELATGSHTCAVFLLTADDRFFKLYDCRSSSEGLQREKVPAGEGILGSVVKRAVPVRVSGPAAIKGITYYESDSQPIRAVLAVPILEGKVVRGVLLVDRLTAVPFTEQDERLLSAVSAEVLRAIEVERVMGYIRRTRDEKDRFFRAIEELNRAGNPEQVFLAVIESVRQLAELDFCAVTLVAEEDGKRVHRVVRMSGVTAKGRALEGRSFDDNNGLVANVVRYGAPLPGRELQAMDRPVIFDAETQVRGLSSIKIFPLTAGDRILGTLVVGARKKAALDQEALRMIEVIAIQAAQAVLQAQLFEQMEQMAITDGLTRLLNHRAFQAKADQAFAQAKRYGRNCSLVFLDVDHFKAINDTYGHPSGDMVLKDLARILEGEARDTDIVARYGGEEFAVVMPETDGAGAQVIAERIRETVARHRFQAEGGVVKVTISLGIAAFPDHGSGKQEVIHLADQCLYEAKRKGRNRSISPGQMPPATKMPAKPPARLEVSP